MDADGPVELIVGVFVAALIALIGLAILGTVSSLEMAPKPGEPFYEAWSATTNIGGAALVLAVPGAGAVGLWVLTQVD